MNIKKIALGCDHGGFELKEKVAVFLRKTGYDILDCGAYSDESMDYPDTAYKAACAVSKHKADAGILICKSGIGNSIVANKVSGVRAALCYNMKAAKLSRQHNDANVLVLGASFIKADMAKKIVAAWLKTSFEGGRHLRRIKKIERIEKKCR
ncbi:MAG: ribose 5-phosphate isomerase B [Candidatus Omnitrophota bacterium]